MLGPIAVMLSFNVILPLVPVIIIAILIIAAAGLTRGVDMFALFGLGALIGLGGRGGGGVGKGGVGKGISGVKYRGDVIARGKATKKAGALSKYAKSLQKKAKGAVKTKIKNKISDMRGAAAAGRKAQRSLLQQHGIKLAVPQASAPSKTSARWTTQSGRFTFNPNSKNPSSVYIPLAATALAIGAAAKRHSQVKKEKASILKGEDELLQKGGGGADYFQAKKQKTREAKSAFYEQKKKERGEEKAQNREKKAQDAQASKQKIREQKADFKKMWGSMNSEERKNYAKDARKAYFWGGDQKYINYKTGKPVEGVFEKGVIASGVAQWVRASRQKREPTNLAAPSSGNKNVSDSERKEKVDQQKQQAEEQSRKEEEKAQKEKEEKAQKEKEEQERKEKEDKG